jgi:hypothetical protein
MPADAAATTRIERAPIIGPPLGKPEWIAMLERRLGKYSISFVVLISLRRRVRRGHRPLL